MNEDVKKLGEIFKSKRKELHLSLKEVENSTSIRMNYLQAIEEGLVEQFLSSVYMVGFAKQYASFLGMDGDQIIKDFPSVFHHKNEKHDFAYGIGTLEVRGSMGGGVKWFPNLLWAALFVIIIVLAWYLAKYLGVL